MTTLPAFPFVDYSRPSRAFCGLVILGEAPGRREVEQGRPFVGRSGELLQKTLTAAGIDRETCLIANVFRYRPPGNDARVFFHSARAANLLRNSRALNLGPSIYGYCRPEFLDEINQLEATLREARSVLSLGTIPLWATTGQRKLSLVAGQTLAGTLAAVPVTPTYHPAFILRGRHSMIPEWQSHMVTAARFAHP